ncbi:MAG: arylesterase [Pseudomonadota bacterium]
MLLIVLLLPAWAHAAPVLLVFGDSLAAAYGLPREEGWVALLQQRLAKEGYDYTVVNASISGETTSGGLTRLDAALRAHRPRIVILELGANDGLRGQPLAATRANLITMIASIRRSGARALLVGMRLPPNYGPAYVQEFETMYARIARSQRVALVPFLFAGFADQAEFFQPDGLHPNADAQQLALDNVWKELKALLRR